MSLRVLLTSLFCLATVSSCKTARPTEFVNIAFTPSVETGHYATWDFDLESCRDFGDDRVDDVRVREYLLQVIEDELVARGFERRDGEPVDFYVHYELRVALADEVLHSRYRVRGVIFLRDTATMRLVWRGERKTLAHAGLTDEEAAAAIRRFANDLLQYTEKL